MGNWLTTVRHGSGRGLCLQSAFDGMFERSSINGRSSLNTSNASSCWQPQPISLQIGTSVVYSDTWSHVTRYASDMVHETANVKPHKSKHCLQEFAQWKLLQQLLTRQIGNHTFVFRRHYPVGWQRRVRICCGEKRNKRHLNGHADERINFEDFAKSKCTSADIEHACGFRSTMRANRTDTTPSNRSACCST